MRHLLACLVLSALSGLPHPLVAEPPDLRVPNEQRPALGATEAELLARYRHKAITHITFHHEGFAGEDADLFARASAARDRQSLDQRMRNLNRFHRVDRRFGMIAYHYAIDKAGGIAKGRPVRFKPATGSTVIGGGQRADFEGHFAVVVLGDFNHERLTAPARAALVSVMSEAQRTYGVPQAHILPHKHHAATSCPGRFLLAEAGSLAQSVTAYSLQSELLARGCSTDPPDGVIGPASLRGFERFLSANPDFAGARPDDATLLRMLMRPTATCKAPG